MKAKKRQSSFKHGGIEVSLLKRLKVATKLEDKEIVKRYKMFNKRHPKGNVSSDDFREMSLKILDESEVDEFVSNVFYIFDLKCDQFMNFEKLTLATEMHYIHGNVLDKFSWLLDHVYYYEETKSREELAKILITLLKMEYIELKLSQELIIQELFNDMELSDEGLVNQKEFLTIAKQSEILWTIMDSSEQRRLTESHELGDANDNFYPHSLST